MFIISRYRRTVGDIFNFQWRQHDIINLRYPQHLLPAFGNWPVSVFWMRGYVVCRLSINQASISSLFLIDAPILDLFILILLILLTAGGIYRPSISYIVNLRFDLNLSAHAFYIFCVLLGKGRPESWSLSTDSRLNLKHQ